MTVDQLLSSGVNDEELDTGVNVLDEEETDLDNEEMEDDEEETNDWDQSQKKDRKKKYHSTVTIQNRRISQLEKELANKAKEDDLSDDDLALLQEKYDEQDLNVIKKLIKKEARNLIDNDKSSSLQQRELWIFFKKHPEITEPELKHVKDLQNQYGYSLEKAYSVLFGRNDTEDKRSNRSVNSFGWDAKWWSKSQDWGNDEAYNDMVKNYTK